MTEFKERLDGGLFIAKDHNKIELDFSKISKICAIELKHDVRDIKNILNYFTILNLVIMLEKKLDMEILVKFIWPKDWMIVKV